MPDRRHDRQSYDPDEPFWTDATEAPPEPSKVRLDAATLEEEISLVESEIAIELGFIVSYLANLTRES